MAPVVRAVVAVMLAWLLGGCATAYQPLGATGGWQEEKLDEDTYRVSFFGNGNTPRPAVLKYFLHRCAELTLEKGYAYFELFATQRQAMEAGNPFLRTRGSRGAARTPAITVVPGAGRTITTYSASAIVRMHPEGLLGDTSRLFSAREVIGMLGTEVRAGNPSPEIPAKFRRVEGQFPVLPAERARAPERQRVDGPVDLDDLQGLMKK